ncbi:MAG: response regulator transcription factor [Bacteroidales bacterium]|nr:response regulator transcription factor [Bacteroidales bacterium]
MAQSIKNSVVIADSQFLVTESLRILLQNSERFTFIGLVYNLNDLSELISKEIINLLITDFNLFDFGGFETIGSLMKENPNITVLILTNHVNRNDLQELTKIGIKDIILKTSSKEELFMAIDATMNRKKYYSDEILNILLKDSIVKSQSKVEFQQHLTPSEIEIIRMIADGLTTKEIANKKMISFHTVTSHRKNIFRKVEINNTSELIMYAIKAGLIDNIDYYI